MTLNEAIEHIRTTKACGSVVAAQVQLKQGISRGSIPVKWADSKNGPNMRGLRNFARLQLVLAEPGFAPDRVSFSLRPLLVFRSAVIEGLASTGEETKNRPEKGETEQWMSLVEAVEHIRMSQDCDSIEALRQLKGEIGDGMVPTQWDHESDDGPNTSPDRQSLRTSKFWLLGGGFAPDESGERGTFRPLLVDRSVVQKLWPLQGSPRENPPSISQIRDCLREIYAHAGDDPPNKEDAWKEVQKRLSNAHRQQTRDILDEGEFANQRNKPGNQPKR